MQPIERPSIVQQLIVNLKKLIVSRDYKPGDKMPTEREICECFGVSRSTVREAYKMLQVQGVLEGQPGRGSFLARSAPEPAEGARRFGEAVSFTDYMQARAAIEPLCVQLAMERADEVFCGTLRALCEQFARAAAQEDIPEMLRADEEFHFAIAKASRNPLFIRFFALATDAFAADRARCLCLSEGARHALASHRAIADAFSMKAPQVGKLAMERHLLALLEGTDKTRGGLEEN